MKWKDILLAYLIYREAKWLYNRVKARYIEQAYEKLRDEVEAKFDVEVVLMFISEDGTPMAVVYDPAAFSYYELALDHEDEPENPFDAAIDDLFGE